MGVVSFRMTVPHIQGTRAETECVVTIFVSIWANMIDSALHRHETTNLENEPTNCHLLKIAFVFAAIATTTAATER